MDKVSSLVKNAMAAELLIVGYDHGIFRHLKEPISGMIHFKFKNIRVKNYTHLNLI